MTQQFNPFAGITGVSATRDSEYFRAGRYIAHIDEFRCKPKRDQPNIWNVFFATTIVAVLDTTACAREPKGPHAVGHHATWLMPMHKKPTLPNLKAAVMAITGMNEAMITEEVLKELTSDAQPLHGIFVEFDNQVIITQKEQKPFTKVTVKRRISGAEVLEVVGETTLKRLQLDVSKADD